MGKVGKMQYVNERRVDLGMRTSLLEAAAQLLAEEGPGSLTTRRVAAQAGSSTMGVYTHFGSMGELVRAVVDEGFARLSHLLTQVPRTDNALVDLAGIGQAYLVNALANPHLYAVMFGAASLGQYRPQTTEERNAGKYTFDEVIGAASRAIAAGQLHPADPVLVASQLWSAAHGVIMLYTGGYFGDSPRDASRILLPALENMMIGLGAAPEVIREAIREARQLRTPG